MPYHNIEKLRPKDDAVIPRWVTIKNYACGTLTKGTFSSRLLLSNQDKGCTPSVAHSLPLPPGFCSTCLYCVVF